jgi:manganese-dependent ADP-ribose/CDP-alcohol diphosphatase
MAAKAVRPDPFSAADASSSDDDEDQGLPRLPPGRPFTPASPPPSHAKPPPPQLHRHASHVRLPSPLPALPPRGPASTDLFGPLVARVGVISDVQHAAGVPDGKSFHGVPRFYADALKGAQRAGRAFRRQRVRAVIHLGDTVDGQHAARGVGSSEDALRSVVEALVGRGGAEAEGEEDEDEDEDDGEGGDADVDDGARRPSRRRPPPLLQVTSNHDIYNFGADRRRLNALLGISAPAGEQHDGASYYSFALADGWRAVALDAYDVSLVGRAPGDPRHALAAETLRARNPNGSDARPQGWDSPEGLKGVARRFVRFGGGAGEAQVAWLRAELAGARAAGERVLLLSHLPLHPATAPPACLLWNYEEVVGVLEEYPATVAAVLTGHAHMNGYCFAPHGTGVTAATEGADDAPAGALAGAGGAAAAAAAGRTGGGGIHHLVLPCVLETPPDRDCWAVLDIHARGLLLRGVDTCMSLAMAVGQAPGGGDDKGGRGAEEAQGAGATTTTAAAAAAAAVSAAGDALSRVAIAAEAR